MSDSSFLSIIKKSAMDAFYQSKPCDTFIGTVKRLEPLKIGITDKLIVSGRFLTVTSRVRDLLNNAAEDEKAEQRIRAGDRVVLIRKQGGQSYVVIDKVVG